MSMASCYVNWPNNFVCPRLVYLVVTRLGTSLSWHKLGLVRAHARPRPACPISCLLKSHPTTGAGAKRQEQERRARAAADRLAPATDLPLLLAMGSLLENLQKKRLFPTMPYKDDLPTFRPNQQRAQQQQQPDAHLIGLRKRISSFSVKIQPLSADWAAFRRSQSAPSFGDLAGVRRWWGQCWGWILSRKPAFARDIEMNEEETAMLGFQFRGSWRHILHRVRSEIRKLIRSNSLPTTDPHGFRYDSFAYAPNFDGVSNPGAAAKST
ncbi:uncharacterized protein LOC121968031 [Zingiber officinale]|uniref:uncharacterized protein LOC121968031 n=1 Tax=Zingiber officinale TaxID=94328 RepID=UPI001C4AB723|nr:uncharacterized protein LOC121968031 [Zingiber officinale]